MLSQIGQINEVFASNNIVVFFFFLNAVLLDSFLKQNSMQSLPPEFLMKMRSSIELTGAALIDRLTVRLPLIIRVNSLSAKTLIQLLLSARRINKE